LVNIDVTIIIFLITIFFPSKINHRKIASKQGKQASFIKVFLLGC